MGNALKTLIADTISYLKQEYSSKDTLHLSPETLVLLARWKKEPQPKNIPAFTMPSISKASPPLPQLSPLKKSAPKKVEIKIESSFTSPSPRPQGFKESSPFDEQLLAKIAPRLQIKKEPLNDKEAKSIAQTWKEKERSAPVVILFLAEKGEERQFLENLALAITRFLPAKVIEEKRYLHSEESTLIIAGSWVQKMPPFRYLPSTGQYFLGKVPLIILAPLQQYFKEPNLKRQLWQMLCSRLSS